MKIGDAASRPCKAGLIIGAGLPITQHKHRPAKALYQPAGYNPKDAEMPVLAREHERGRIEFRRRFLALLQDAFDDRNFHLLAFAILTVELFGKSLGACRVRREKQFDDVASSRHAAGGVDTRSEPERHLMS